LAAKQVEPNERVAGLSEEWTELKVPKNEGVGSEEIVKTC